jgi:hypothetical protein
MVVVVGGGGVCVYNCLSFVLLTRIFMQGFLKGHRLPSSRLRTQRGALFIDFGRVVLVLWLLLSFPCKWHYEVAV